MPKTKTYEQLQRQILALQTEAEKLRRKELDGVVARMREAIDFYQLTAADLGFGAAGVKAPGPKKAVAVPRKARAAKKAPVVRAVAYSNGAGGTWGGRGKRPQWLRDALSAGRTLEEFKVKAD